MDAPWTRTLLHNLHKFTLPFKIQKRWPEKRERARERGKKRVRERDKIKIKLPNQLLQNFLISNQEIRVANIDNILWGGGTEGRKRERVKRERPKLDQSGQTSQFAQIRL